MCEHSSADQTAVQRRREERRRKILENSKSRLKLIENINTATDKPEICSETKCQPKIAITESALERDINNVYTKPEVSSKIIGFIKESKELKEISDFIMKDGEEGGGGEEEEEEEEVNENYEEELISQLEEKQENQYIDIILRKRLHYLILAVAVNVMFLFDIGYLFFENIFCPFYTVKIVELLSRRGEKIEFAPFLFLVIAGLPQKAQKLTKIILTIFSALFSDLFLYIFTFVIGMKIINVQV